MYNKTLSELAQDLEKKIISSKELVTYYLKRIEALRRLNAFITIDEERVRQEADESDSRRARGMARSKYDGIPIAIKDNICTAGLKTTCGSKMLHNFVSPYSATAYRKLQQAGFITLGKTNMDEFGMGSSTETSYYGPTTNPYDESKVAGGSSGGSAAAVAAGLAPAALGSDTGGSIRQPAAFCGIVGIKPTYGRVSRYGLIAYASSLDQIGTFGKNVADAATILALIAGYDACDSTSVPIGVDFDKKLNPDNINGKIIGVPEEYFIGVDEEIVRVVKRVAGDLERKGARIEPISLKYTEYAVPTYYLIATAEASSNLARFDGVQYGYRAEQARNCRELYVRTRSEGFGREVKRRIILGTFALSWGYYDAYYLQALKVRKLIIDDFKSAFGKVDFIIAPTTTTTAFGIGERISDPLSMYMSDVLTISANLAGIPALSVPAGLSRFNLPIGIQIMGKHFDETGVIDCAKAIEDIVGTFAPSL
ncbi:MAG: Asp-tRNA(Asn)/Glu-tRNA(Gln) amidotransferase subunit GatA [Spirochaetes bacterium]|nr:Asp-tRNA(Asn)/Glu-tRNA(Gln) amidotransferase subunit GatA [Spirochaetota bacterium]